MVAADWRPHREAGPLPIYTFALVIVIIGLRFAEVSAPTIIVGVLVAVGALATLFLTGGQGGHEVPRRTTRTGRREPTQAPRESLTRPVGAENRVTASDQLLRGQSTSQSRSSAPAA
jgi:hypothetical protein